MLIAAPVPRRARCDVPVVVRIDGPDALVLAYRVQRHLPEPVHLWFCGPRSLDLDPEEKHRLVLALEAEDAGPDRSPFVRPAVFAARQGSTVAEILRSVLVAAPRACWSDVGGKFQGIPVVAVDPATHTPFPGPYALASTSGTRVGEGPLADVHAHGLALPAGAIPALS